MNSRQEQEYHVMVSAGVSPKLAEMLALQQGPGLQTDTRFMRGRSGNRYWSHQLSSYVGSRSDVRRICAAKGMDCIGSTSYTATRDAPRPDEVPYEVSADLVKNYVQDVVDEYPTALRDDPELPRKVKERLRGDVV